MAEPRDRSPGRAPRRPWAAATWPQWALGAVGVIQIGLATAQGLGAGVGMAARGADAHLLNESTAWSAALGVAMIVAALRPAAASGPAAVLAVFSLVLGGFVIDDLTSGAVTLARILTHLPVVVGTALTLLIWRAARRTQPSPLSGAVPPPDDLLVLPANATRGRRRGRLYPTDGSAA